MKTVIKQPKTVDMFDIPLCVCLCDDKVGTDFLEEEITKFEDLVQSVDIAAFNKI